MSELPQGITRGDRARLFPILADRSAEGRTLSIFLATLVNVRPFAEKILGDLGRRVGPLATMQAFTEVCFKNEMGDAQDRPDGLLILDTGRTRWTALVEAKVRKNEIQAEQLNRYLKIAKSNGIDAVITLSNQFSMAPHHHPVSVNSPKGIELFHLSWMRVLTDSFLLLNEGLENDLEGYMLNEFKRFISHDSAGVESFTQMPSEWSTVCDLVQTGANVTVGPGREIVSAWHQECQDLSLIFSRQIDTGVIQRLSRAETSNPAVRAANDLELLREDHALSVEFDVPDAAAPIKVFADMKRRTISVSMYVGAPGDKKRNSARINWLLRQLPKEGISNVHLRARWPATSPWTQMPLSDAFECSDLLCEGKGKMEIVGFEVTMVIDLGHRFSKPRIFIEELEKAVPEFYERVGQNLRSWVRPAPKVKEERSDPDTVRPSAISD